MWHLAGQCLGILLMMAGLVDIFLTVLFARNAWSLLSDRIFGQVWRTAAWIHRHTTRDGSVLSLAGPVGLVVMLATWVALLTVGFALVILPLLGDSIRDSGTEPPRGFANALFLSIDCFTTAGSAPLLPITPTAKILTAFQSLVGIIVITLSVTYCVQLYGSLLRRNAMALSLHLATAETGNAAHLLAGMGARGDFQDAIGEISQLNQTLTIVYESFHLYPPILYFRFGEARYASPRIAMIILELATLIRSVLCEQRYAHLRSSGSVEQLWRTGLHITNDLCTVFLPQQIFDAQRIDDPAIAREWRHRFDEDLKLLEDAGIATCADRAAAFEKYVQLRQQWERQVRAFAEYMQYPLGRIEKIEPTTA